MFEAMSCDVRQMPLFAVRCLVSPHDKHDFEPLGCQSTDGLVVSVPERSLFVEIGFGPLRFLE